tara:strand:+ start:357 stop:500 length:144 start_codon:yes stop_codon:yes gene_type:complete
MKGLRLSKEKRKIVNFIMKGWTAIDGSDRANEEILTDIIENDIELID